MDAASTSRKLSLRTRPADRQEVAATVVAAVAEDKAVPSLEAVEASTAAATAPWEVAITAWVVETSQQ